MNSRDSCYFCVNFVLLLWERGSRGKRWRGRLPARVRRCSLVVGVLRVRLRSLVRPATTTTSRRRKGIVVEVIIANSTSKELFMRISRDFLSHVPAAPKSEGACGRDQQSEKRHFRAPRSWKFEIWYGYQLRCGAYVVFSP